MKKNYKIKLGEKYVERSYSYIPLRYILAVFITLAEVCAIIGVVVLLCYYVPYFYLAALLTQIGCILKIVASDDNPDYKVPWLLFVLVLPIVGFMLYFIFYSRKLKKKFIKRLCDLHGMGYKKDDAGAFERIKKEDTAAANQARMICNIANTNLFEATDVEYFPSGEEMLARMLVDLKSAERFIYMEYFIIEEGVFWNSILDILTQEVKEGVEVKLLYDDIGCMTTLPGNYAKELKKYGIEGVPFSRLKGSADSEFNNRNHRKITVIDGKIGYTGGVNIADEYINRTERFGHWKDTAIRLCGEAVWELTKTFIIDYGINVKSIPDLPKGAYPDAEKTAVKGYVIPFGDAPQPMDKYAVGKEVIMGMLASATEYAYITTPYLIIDNELCGSIENAALRGVDVRITVPHIPDKKIVFAITRSYYPRLMKAGVKIYEYAPGFIHAKNYIVDGRMAMVGTINLDYRSLAHHFENGVWMYGCPCIEDIRRDIVDTMEKSIPVTEDMTRTGPLATLIRSLVRVFSPLL